MITKFRILDHVRQDGHEAKDIVKNLKWQTDLNFSAGQLTFDLVKAGTPIVPAQGAIVDFAWDNTNIFWGFVFKSEYKGDNTVSVTAYDFMRYLKSEGSIVFQSHTLADRVTEVCRRDGVPFRIVNRPSYRVPAEVCDGKTGFDMIKSAIDKTYTATGQRYVLSTNYKIVELRKAPFFNKQELVIDSRTTMTDYTYTESIDNAANVVQVVHKDQKKSQTKTATASSTTGDDPKTTSFTVATVRGNTIKQWGQMIKVENAKEKANFAQMVQQAKDKLKELNQIEKTLTVDCIGEPSLVPGSGANVYIKDLGLTWKNCPILKATHNFGVDYTCSLEMKVGNKWQENGSTS
ncbi:XkdQ/YqbQ family protein [Lactobacillus hominis]|uniref:YqbQ/XkdQ domain-containing protein n=1 Tax=Lactobacillus hominis DSM 23910 = CRBIP 24.179 TaxID=1423758 RepID=I7KH14_9LACO|nr:hypothetical protein [Lactobacillus hominis]KRM85744.1 hypothetical protein FC41_GL001059 [Lactobacillus hominis DSM 23910 = CRBIP 24.179]MCT3347209.1 late control protein D [Lactobacillus hominis]CCI81735.1 Putative uncharacterized protein orf50 [Lactobacillus hominis DSM 23910 = CRBIP 24.179]